MDHSNNSLQFFVQKSNGQQQIIKIVRNPNGQPLTQEGVNAIVKEVTGHDGSKLIGNTIINNIRHVTESPQKYQHSLKQEPDDDVKPQISSAATKTTAKYNAAQVQTPYKGKQGTSKMATMSPHTSTSYATSSSGAKKVTPSQTTIRRRKTDRVGKGLRHFSMKVCEKVKEKGTTTYNEVADELVEEEAKGQPIDPANYDQKNIRRRVYDALNVLMAMNIISKDKKEIRWIGLPTNSAQQCNTLEKENQSRRERIEAKQQQLRELILQQVSFKSLVTRNKEAEERGIVPSSSSAIQMPFIIVNTHKKTNINCSVSNDKSEYMFKFADKFEIHDDIEVLKRMGLLAGLDTGDCTQEDIQRAKTMVPKSFEKFIDLYGNGQDDDYSGEWDSMPYDSSANFTAKTEPLSDDEDMDDEHYTDASDIE